MKRINRIFKPLLALSLMTVMYSCNNNSETTKEEPKKAEDSAKNTAATEPAAPAVAAPAAFTPFDVVEISHKVKDYAKWKPFFDTDSVNRKAAGLENMVVGRGIDNPNNLLIVLGVADVKKAKDFEKNPKLKEVMDKAGVVSKPVSEFFHVIRFNAESKEKQWVIVTHKVKDFDAWLKVFDAEGTASRASQGLIDVALARDINDSSMVQLVFDIKDMAKAKASILSEEKKKLMMSAGVVGAPKIEFFSTAE